MSTKDHQNEPQTVLLTGGRAPCTLELARALHKAGHRVVVAESTRYHLCGASRAVAASFLVPAPNIQSQLFIDHLLSIVMEEKVDVLIPTCEEIFYVSKGLDDLSKHCKVWASPIEQLNELHNKWTFVKLAERLKLNVPQSQLIQSQEELQSFANRSEFHDGFVIKPAYSRFGSRVLSLYGKQGSRQYEQLLDNMLAQASFEQPWVAQRRIVGRQLCTYSIAHQGELLAHSTYPCQYTVGKGTAIYFEAIEHQATLEWVRTLVRELSFTGQISFDFIEMQSNDEEGDRGELYAIECNPRATSGLHLFAGVEEFVQIFVAEQESTGANRLLTPPNTSKKMITAAMITAGLARVRSLRQWKDWYRAVRSADDVVISKHDPKPSIQQLRVAYQLWRTSKRHNVTLQQATTIDIEWNGDV